MTDIHHSSDSSSGDSSSGDGVIIMTRRRYSLGRNERSIIKTKKKKNTIRIIGGGKENYDNTTFPFCNKSSADEEEKENCSKRKNNQCTVLSGARSSSSIIGGGSGVLLPKLSSEDAFKKKKKLGRSKHLKKRGQSADSSLLVRRPREITSKQNQTNTVNASLANITISDNSNDSSNSSMDTSLIIDFSSSEENLIDTTLTTNRPNCADPVAITLLNDGREVLDLLLAEDCDLENVHSACNGNIVQQQPNHLMQVSDCLSEIMDVTELSELARPMAIPYHGNDEFFFR